VIKFWEFASRFLLRTRDFKNQIGAREDDDDDDVLRRTLQLLTRRLESQVATARENLPKAAKEQPMFGLMLCMRSVLKHCTDRSALKSWVPTVVALYKVISGIVSKVLNSDSPEGQG
jgi:hypothetical protein